MKLLFLDTETTGISREDRLCQLAYSWEGTIVNQLFKPPVPIAVGAMAVNHITNEMVADAPVFRESHWQSALQKLLEDPEIIMVAHNAPFDIGMLQREGVITRRYICTSRLWKLLDPYHGMESHSLQYLRYYYSVNVDAQAHSAAGDIRVLEEVFNKGISLYMEENPSLTREQAMAEVEAKTCKPLVLKSFPFGKYKGLPLNSIPKGYFRWVLETGDFSEDILATARAQLD